jgi:hypothetical protein
MPPGAAGPGLPPHNGSAPIPPIPTGMGQPSLDPNRVSRCLQPGGPAWTCFCSWRFMRTLGLGSSVTALCPSRVFACFEARLDWQNRLFSLYLTHFKSAETSSSCRCRPGSRPFCRPGRGPDGVAGRVEFGMGAAPAGPSCSRSVRWRSPIARPWSRVAGSSFRELRPSTRAGALRHPCPPCRPGRSDSGPPFILRQASTTLGGRRCQFSRRCQTQSPISLAVVRANPASRSATAITEAPIGGTSAQGKPVASVTDSMPGRRSAS